MPISTLKLSSGGHHFVCLYHVTSQPKLGSLCWLTKTGNQAILLANKIQPSPHVLECLFAYLKLSDETSK